MATFDEVIGRVGRPIRSVTLCLDSTLAAEHDEAETALQAADRMADMSLGGSGDRAELAARVRDIEAQMKASEMEFRFRGLGMYELAELQRKHPPVSGQRGVWDINAGAAELIALTCVSPEMSLPQAEQLLRALSHGQADRLVTAAWVASTGSLDVPFSARASERIPPSEQ